MRPSEQILDLTGILTAEALHEYLKCELHFPDYYGGNWDAFWDCICSDEQSRMPKRLIIRGLVELQANLPESANRITECLLAYRDELHDRDVDFIK